MAVAPRSSPGRGGNGASRWTCRCCSRPSRSRRVHLGRGGSRWTRPGRTRRVVPAGARVRGDCCAESVHVHGEVLGAAAPPAGCCSWGRARGCGGVEGHGPVVVAGLVQASRGADAVVAHGLLDLACSARGVGAVRHEVVAIYEGARHGCAAGSTAGATAGEPPRRAASCDVVPPDAGRPRPGAHTGGEAGGARPVAPDDTVRTVHGRNIVGEPWHEPHSQAPRAGPGCRRRPAFVMTACGGGGSSGTEAPSPPRPPRPRPRRPPRRHPFP